MKLSKEQIEQLREQLEEFQLWNMDNSAPYWKQDDEAIQGAIDVLNEHLEEE